MSFSPQRNAISAITQGNPCVISTSTDHNLSTGQIVRIHVPSNFGMTPLNNNLYSITVLSPSTFSLQITLIPPAVNVDSTFFPAFTIPSNPSLTAEVLSVGAGPYPPNEVSWQKTDNFCLTGLQDATVNLATVNQPF